MTHLERSYNIYPIHIVDERALVLLHTKLQTSNTTTSTISSQRQSL